jgi:hypothetical protein
MKAVSTVLTITALFAVVFMVAVGVLDPMVAAVQSYDLGGLGGTVGSIHVAIVKYSVPVFLASLIIWGVTYIMRRERQTVR